MSREPQRHLGIHLVGQRDPARAGDDEARGGGFELERQHVAANLMRPVSWPMPSSPANRSSTAELDVVARLVERAGARRGELRQAGRAAPAETTLTSDSTGIARAVGVERIRAVPADERRAGDAAGAFLMSSRRGARRCLRIAAARSRCRTSRRRRAVLDLHRPKPNGRQVLAVERGTRPTAAVHLVVVELEGVLADPRPAVASMRTRASISSPLSLRGKPRREPPVASIFDWPRVDRARRRCRRSCSRSRGRPRPCPTRCPMRGAAHR